MKLPDWTRRPRKAVLTGIQRVRNWTRSLGRFVQAKCGSLVLLVLVVAAAVGIWAVMSYWDWLSTTFWEWLRGGPDLVESGSTTVRNLGLVLAGVIALPLAIWRSLVAQRQADTAQQDLLNERYQRGAEMLGNDVLAVRLGGIYALSQLNREYLEQYHIQIMQLLCAFVRHPTKDVNFPEQPEDTESFVLREDVQAAIRVIGARGDRHRRLAGEGAYYIDLHGADLRGGELRGLNLSRPTADMITSIPAPQAFYNPSLRTDLSGARFHGAQFFLTEISGVDFSRNGKSPATGLWTFELLGASWDDANPPELKGSVDAVTGEPLDVA